jgi:hypothetical protein
MNMLTIGLESLNLFSFMLGMFFAGTMFRARALIYVCIYFMALAGYYWWKSGAV